MAATTPRAVIVGTARTAIGTSRKGTLANVESSELAKPVVAAAIERSGLDAADFDDLILAEVYQGGGDIARYVAVDLGLPALPGLALNRQCASSLSAIAVGAGQIAAGMSRAVLAGGAESCSTAPISRKRRPFTSGTAADDYADPWFSLSHPPTPGAPAMDMSITVAHNCAMQFGISREAQDRWALRSHQRAIKAIDAGSFVDEIVPIEVPRADGTMRTFAEDEHPRRNTTLESLAALKVLHPEIEGFTVTAGNSSGINDAAAAVALASPHTRTEVLANVLAWSSVGVRRTAPVPPRSWRSRRLWSWPGAGSRMWRCSRSTRRSLPRPSRVCASLASMRRSSTSTAPALAWAIPSPPPARGW